MYLSLEWPEIYGVRNLVVLISISYLVSNCRKRHEFTRSLLFGGINTYRNIAILKKIFYSFYYILKGFLVWHRGSTIALHSISNLVICISTTLLFSYNKFEYSVFRTLVGTRKQFYLFTLTGATAMSNDGNTVLPPNSTSLSWKKKNFTKVRSSNNISHHVGQINYLFLDISKLNLSYLRLW